jgi:hypothetical protein
MVNVKDLYQKLTATLDQRSTPPVVDDLASLRKEIDEVWDQVKKLDEKTFEVDTPWHAAVVLIDLMASAASAEPLDETSAHVKDLSQLKSVPAMQYVFRGEGNYTYALCPSYFRPYNDGRHPELSRAINNFAAMLKYASDHCFANDTGRQNFDIGLFVGAAQHYAGNTHLMDWTTDPCIAVGFAADYAPKDPFSVVYALPTFRAVQHNAKFYLPPPFVERLYLQRGLFIETPEREDDHALQESCISIRFREDREFKVIRNGHEIQDLMKPFAALDELAKHAKSQATDGVQFIDGSVKTPEDAERILREEWDKIGGLPEFLRPAMGEEHAENWRTALLDMIERLSHLKTSKGLKVNEFILQPVVCSNSIMMTAFQKWLEIQEKWARDKANNELAARGWGDLARLLKKLLGNCV